jgi:Ca2+-binding RTX toxin-like protein
MNIVDIAAGDDRFNILVKAVTAANLGAALSNEDTDLTVFAPTDAAFVKLAQAFGYAGDPADEDAVFDAIAGALALLAPDGDPIPILTNVLLYHVAPGALESGDVLALTDVPNLLGGALTLSGVELIDGDDDLPNAVLTDPDGQLDIIASNGVIHAIDEVLIPIDLPENIIVGTQQGDALTGSTGDDLIRGYQGDDTIEAGNGDDVVYGNQGEDTIFGETGHDVAFGGQGSDWLEGNGGNDTLWGNKAADTVSAGAGSDVVYGNQGDDYLMGGGDGDNIFGGQGDDTLMGDAGADMLFGNKGDDWLSGGSGNDGFVYDAQNGGEDMIADFSDGEDLLYFIASTDSDVVAQNVDGGAMISVNGGDDILLVGFDANNFDENDYMFV